MDIKRYNTTARYSDLVVHNHTAYFVEVPASASTDAGEQIREILSAAETTLALTGTSPSRLLSATIYLTDMADYAAINAVWDKWLPAGTAPSRVCVQVSALARPEWRLEIAFIAAV